jgi:hypothetical protein
VFNSGTINLVADSDAMTRRSVSAAVIARMEITIERSDDNFRLHLPAPADKAVLGLRLLPTEKPRSGRQPAKDK